MTCCKCVYVYVNGMCACVCVSQAIEVASWWCFFFVRSFLPYTTHNIETNAFYWYVIPYTLSHPFYLCSFFARCVSVYLYASAASVYICKCNGKMVHCTQFAFGIGWFTNINKYEAKSKENITAKKYLERKAQHTKISRSTQEEWVRDSCWKEKEICKNYQVTACWIYENVIIYLFI